MPSSQRGASQRIATGWEAGRGLGWRYVSFLSPQQSTCCNPLRKRKVWFGLSFRALILYHPHPIVVALCWSKAGECGGEKTFTLSHDRVQKRGGRIRGPTLHHDPKTPTAIRSTLKGAPLPVSTSLGSSLRHTECWSTGPNWLWPRIK